MNKSQWQIRDRFIVMLVIAFGIAIFGIVVLPRLASTGRHYGNELMRMRCYQELRALKRAATDSPNFDFSKLSDENKHDIIIRGSNSDFWIKTNFAWEVGGSNRQVVIVCGKEFDNVPKPGFWNYFWRNPAHAVGYSDEKTGLISPEQFTNLISAGFVSMLDLATNATTGLFK
jgi:hypothetical protein